MIEQLLEDPIIHCDICLRLVEDCICPVCKVCWVIGDPSCINNHMNWDAWRNAILDNSNVNIKYYIRCESVVSGCEVPLIIYAQSRKHAIGLAERYVKKKKYLKNVIKHSCVKFTSLEYEMSVIEL